ncbi:MAG: hypothetical protein CHACPFDD_02351 [Phycisphaerae bacterium]|nr:hypothetical protein [Phycisphaerae bacterium]
MWLAAAATLSVVCTSLGQSAATRGAESRVRSVRLPAGGMVADAVADDSGELCVVYGVGADIFFHRLTPGGEWTDAAVRVNSTLGSALVRGERGPRIALGKGAVVHVVWTGQGASGLCYARSLDGGKRFEPQQRISDARFEAEGPAVFADRRGRVGVLVLDSRLGEAPEAPISFAPAVRWSSDDGAEFAPGEPISRDARDRACMCCEPAAVSGPAGDFVLVHRMAYDSLRDMLLWRWSPGEPSWRRTPISADRWKLVGCPMSAPAVARSVDGKLLAAAWMSDQRVYFATMPGDGESFSPRVRLDEGAAPARQPSVAIAADGAILTTWVSEGAIRWKLHEAGGRAVAQHGSFDFGESWKPKAVASRERFFVLY